MQRPYKPRTEPELNYDLVQKPSAQNPLVQALCCRAAVHKRLDDVPWKRADNLIGVQQPKTVTQTADVSND